MKLVGGDQKVIEVLLVEDSPGDVRLTREAFRNSEVSVRLHIANDGVEAVAFLHKQGMHADAPRPDLILLDLNMPNMDGREVLRFIKEDRSLTTIPTAILTTSDEEGDVLISNQLKAIAHLRKPVRLDDFESLIRSISDSWLTKVNLPEQANPD